MVPPAPGRFSTTTGRCSRSPSRSARSRASKSVVVPTLKPQMMWTGFDGQGAWAVAARDIADAQPRATKVRRRIWLAPCPYRPSRLVRRLVRKVDQKPGSRGWLRLAADITR